ncbi:polyA polymerase family protein [Rhodospirillum centenum SW]|uniref:PolyA polymerase family protein n=2 Tax=Rhodospirillum centenum TaxID=34018 RepID=B6IWV3_RHOCS|nr:polyA polymerase family protein [Rhodospirillum centenum SW]
MKPVGTLEPVGLMATVQARLVLQALMRTGQEARFVGGCVRDAVLGQEADDVDIATPLPPDEVMRRLKQDGIRVVPTGIRHGTVTAIRDGHAFEITTLRRDVETYGRHARVEFTDDWLEDARRRDFTFNALSLSSEGDLYDPFGGLADLSAGRVRFVGDAEARIREDVLRILRYFRFHARFGKGGLDDDAIAACAAQAPLLPTLSGERVREELLRLFATDRAVETWRLMLERGIIQHLLPQATRIDTLAALDRLEWMVGEAGPLTQLAALLPRGGEEGRAAALAVADRMRLSNAQRDRLLVLCAPPLAVDAGLDVRGRRRALQTVGPELFRDLLLLDTATRGIPAFEILESLAEAAAWRVIPFPLKGQDAVDRGVPQGPAVGRLLEAVEGWWAGRDYRPGREDCLAELERRLAAPPDPSSPDASP